MTVTAHNDPHPFTDGDDVRERVSAAKSARVLPIRPDLTSGSAHVRAVQDEQSKVKDGKRSKVRNFASTHTADARASVGASVLANERPQSLAEVAGQLKTGNPIAVFRLAVYAIAYLTCFAVDTNKRATVTFLLLLLSLTAAWAYSALAG